MFGPQAVENIDGQCCGRCLHLFVGFAQTTEVEMGGVIDHRQPAATRSESGEGLLAPLVIAARP